MSDPNAWGTELLKYRQSVLSRPRLQIDWAAAWERRAAALALDAAKDFWVREAPTDGVLPNDASQPADAPGGGPTSAPHYEDLVLLVQQAMPIGLLLRPWSSLSQIELSVLALEAAGAVATADNSPAAVPPWLMLLAMHWLGFGKDTLNPLYIRLPRPVFSFGMMIGGINPGPESGRGVLIVLGDVAVAGATRQTPAAAPVILVSADQYDRFKAGIDWLGKAVIGGVIDERTVE
jgi:hypothetical protein